MSENIKLDLFDKRIIYELEKNCKITLSTLAKKLNLSKQRVSYKIKRLEENQIILGYSSIIDVSKLGYITFRVYLKFQNRTIQEKKELIEKICLIKGISVVVGLDNVWDLALALMVKKIFDFYISWNVLMENKEYIEKYYVSIYEPIHYMTRTFLNPDSPQVPEIKTVGAHQEISYDKFDLLLLNEYSKNIKQSIVDLSLKLDKSPQMIINRIKYLEKEKVIAWYRPNLNFSKLGYEYYKVFINLNSFNRMQELYNFCISNKFIFQIDKTISEWDFEIEIYAKSKEHFLEVVGDMQKNFNKDIKNYVYFTVSNVYIERFMPDSVER